METKRTKATDLAEIAAALDGKVEFQNIQFSQILTTEHGQSQNDLLFIGRKFGVYFYTSRSSFDAIFYLMTKHKPQFALSMPTYVVCEGSKNVYQITE